MAKNKTICEGCIHYSQGEEGRVQSLTTTNSDGIEDERVYWSDGNNCALLDVDPIDVQKCTEFKEQPTADEMYPNIPRTHNPDFQQF